MHNHLPPKLPPDSEDPALEKYREWISSYEGDIWRKCAQVTALMADEFPELTRVRGHVEIAESDRPQQHWWLETGDGKVVDPTADQWLMILRYHPWMEGVEEPTGKCPECGGYSYGGRTLCSDSCESRYRAYIRAEIGGSRR